MLLSAASLICIMVFLQVEAVIDKILESARTGEIGDGKIFCKAETYFFLAVFFSCYTSELYIVVCSEPKFLSHALLIYRQQ